VLNTCSHSSHRNQLSASLVHSRMVTTRSVRGLPHRAHTGAAGAAGR
jgi:hypothetical protein